VSEIRVAAVIVSYKTAALTIDCLRSIAAERETPGLHITAIVVDNASGDAPQVAAAIQANGWSSWASVLVAPRNGGFAYGNNLGFQRACAHALPAYLHMINPDTVIHPGAISALVSFLEAHPAAGIAGSSFENGDGSAWPIAFRFPSLLGELAGGLELGIATRVLRPWVVARHMTPVAQPTDWVSGASMMIRRAVLEAVGGLDENYFLYFEETDFCFRARKAGFATWYVPESRVMHIAAQSTKVLERNASPRRMPRYWFESRRRYFMATHGVPYAIAVDLVALLAHAIGLVKRILQRRTQRGIPHFVGDLARYSALWPWNWKVPVGKHLAPGARGQAA
jgi:N-acetylglucosaminyl-diphospho-decaprenol L-rhamnosyltransferase